MNLLPMFSFAHLLSRHIAKRNREKNNNFFALKTKNLANEPSLYLIVKKVT